MPEQFQTSFIPKEAITGSSAPKPKSANKRSLGLLNIVAIFSLILSILLAGGVYASKAFLEDEINQPCAVVEGGTDQQCGLRESLTKARESLGESVLVRIERLDLRLGVVNRLLRNHIILTALFSEVLEPLTLQTIQYQSFSYRDNILVLEGTGQSYSDVAVQSRALATEKRIKDFIFYDLDSNSRGQVLFKLRMELDPALLLYENYLTLEQQ